MLKKKKAKVGLSKKAPHSPARKRKAVTHKLVPKPAKESFVVTMGPEEKKRKETTDGYRVNEHLAVTRGPETKNSWDITHLPTGRGLPGHSFRSVSKALVIARKIDALNIPWGSIVSNDKEANKKLIGRKYNKLMDLLDESRK